MILLKILKNLFIMVAITNYYNYSSKIKFYEIKNFNFFAKFFQISDFIKIEIFIDGFFNNKFIGICVKKTNKGFASTFTLVDKFGIYQKFYFFAISIKKLIIFGKKRKKYYKTF